MPQHTSDSHSSLYIGLMSGTSLDGVDGALTSFPRLPSDARSTTLAKAYIPFDPSLKKQLMALQSAGHDEIDRELRAANLLARAYADCVGLLLANAGKPASAVTAIGVHGQTIRHRPELGYTRQTNNPALLAELTGIDVVADFRSRDVAAGGQGAPLVPAFHGAVFGSPTENRVVVNIGGISNISILEAGGSEVSGFDTGPGNVLMDLWINEQRGLAFDADGSWASQGKLDAALLEALFDEPYFALAAPKSTGRDLFHRDWLHQRLQAFSALPARDVQRTLCELTAVSIATAIANAAANCEAVFVCGGGAANTFLIQRIGQALADMGIHAKAQSTAMLGIAPDAVEAIAFAWLAHRFIERRPGNLPAVTGARGPRVLGALYPA